MPSSMANQNNEWISLACVLVKNLPNVDSISVTGLASEQESEERCDKRVEDIVGIRRWMVISSLVGEGGAITGLMEGIY